MRACSGAVMGQSAPGAATTLPAAETVPSSVRGARVIVVTGAEAFVSTSSTAGFEQPATASAMQRVGSRRLIAVVFPWRAPDPRGRVDSRAPPAGRCAALRGRLALFGGKRAVRI